MEIAKYKTEIPEDKFNEELATKRRADMLKYSGLSQYQLNFKLSEYDLKGFGNIFNNYLNYENNYYFHGNVGSGKTYLASVLLKEAIEMHAKVGIFKTVPEFLMKARYEMKAGNEEDFIAYYSELQFFVLDDLCVQRDSAYSNEMLYIILDRYSRNNRKGLIITSNLSLTDLSKKIGDRLASRISGMCEIKKFSGEDRRLK